METSQIIVIFAGYSIELPRMLYPGEEEHTHEIWLNRKSSLHIRSIFIKYSLGCWNDKIKGRLPQCQEEKTHVRYIYTFIYILFSLTLNIFARKAI
jgi:hypothetical protein